MMTDRKQAQLQSLQANQGNLSPRQQQRMQFLQRQQRRGTPPGAWDPAPPPRPGTGQQLPGGRLPDFGTQSGQQIGAWDNVRPMPMPGRGPDVALGQAFESLKGQASPGGANRIQRTLSDFGPMRPGAQAGANEALAQMTDFGPNRLGYQDPRKMRPVVPQADFGPGMGMGMGARRGY